MNKIFNLSVVGTNFIVPLFIDAAQRSGYFKLHSIVSRKFQSGENFRNANQYKDSVLIYDDLQTMLNDDTIDAVYIASPNALHFEQASACLKAGKPVFVEKSITSNTKELASLIALAQEQNILLMEGMRSSVSPNLNKLIENLPRVGKIKQCTSTFAKISSRYQDYLDGKNPNTFNPVFSSGSLMDLGIYCLYPFIQIFDSPIEVHAYADLLDSGVDAAGTVILKYPGFHVTITHSKVSTSHNSTEIQGELGTIIIKNISTLNEMLFIDKHGKQFELAEQQDTNKLFYIAKHFGETLTAGLTESTVNTHVLSTKVMNTLDTVRLKTGVKYPADQ